MNAKKAEKRKLAMDQKRRTHTTMYGKEREGDTEVNVRLSPGGTVLVNVMNDESENEGTFFLSDDESTENDTF